MQAGGGECEGEEMVVVVAAVVVGEVGSVMVIVHSEWESRPAKNAEIGSLVCLVRLGVLFLVASMCIPFHRRRFRCTTLLSLLELTLFSPTLGWLRIAAFFLPSPQPRLAHVISPLSDRSLSRFYSPYHSRQIVYALPPPSISR